MDFRDDHFAISSDMFDGQSSYFFDYHSELVFGDASKNYLFNDKGRHQVKINCDENSRLLFSEEKDKCEISVWSNELIRKPQILIKPDWYGLSKVIFNNVFCRTDATISVISSGVKEKLIIKEKADGYYFGFKIKYKNVTPIFNAKENRLDFVCCETSQKQFFVNAPFMSDSKNELSQNIVTNIQIISDNEMLLTVIPDCMWLNAPERKFPVELNYKFQ